MERSGDGRGEPDILTRLQAALDDVAMKMYTYVGILQRDAPVVAAGASSATVKADADGATSSSAEAEFQTKVKEFASDVVSSHRTVDELIARVRSDIENEVGNEEEKLKIADSETTRAGMELNFEIPEVELQLMQVREGLKEIEADDDEFVSGQKRLNRP